jgi:uncharacterized protein (DUF1778 family)
MSDPPSQRFGFFGQPYQGPKHSTAARIPPLRIFRVYAIVIRMKEQTHASSVLSVRVTPDERALLEAAAEQSRTTLSDFMRRKAVEAAETEILGRSIVAIPAKDWEAFEAWVNRPAEAIPALGELARRRPSWEP